MWCLPRAYADEMVTYAELTDVVGSVQLIMHTSGAYYLNIII